MSSEKIERHIIVNHCTYVSKYNNYCIELFLDSIIACYCFTYSVHLLFIILRKLIKCDEVINNLTLLLNYTK